MPVATLLKDAKNNYYICQTPPFQLYLHSNGITFVYQLKHREKY